MFAANTSTRSRCTPGFKPLALALGSALLLLSAGWMPNTALAADVPCLYRAAEPGPDGVWFNDDDLAASLACNPMGDLAAPGAVELGLVEASRGSVSIGMKTVVEGYSTFSDMGWGGFSPYLPASVGIGYLTRVDGDRNVALGAYSRIGGEFGERKSVNDGVALGFEALVLGNQAVAIGAGATAESENNTAVGFSSTTSGLDSSALGHNAAATARYSTAIGAGAEARANGSLALGAGATAEALQTTAIGRTAKATGEHSIAVGVGARAEGVDSIAIGNFSVADQDGTVSFGQLGGWRRLVNVAAGIGDTDAVNLGQLNAALTSAGGAASAAAIAHADAGDAATLSAANSYTNNRINALATDFGAIQAQLDDRFRVQDRRIDRLSAMSGAYAGVAMDTAAWRGITAYA